MHMKSWNYASVHACCMLGQCFASQSIGRRAEQGMTELGTISLCCHLLKVLEKAASQHC
jgi:hypothetical protein